MSAPHVVSRPPHPGRNWRRAGTDRPQRRGLLDTSQCPATEARELPLPFKYLGTSGQIELNPRPQRQRAPAVRQEKSRPILETSNYSSGPNSLSSARRRGSPKRL
jgi:hypothetical protein